MPDANPPPTGLAARSRVLCSVLTHLMAHPVSCTRIRGLCTTGAAGEPIIERRRTRRCRDTACAGCVWGSPWGRFRRGELDFLLLACSVARQLADSALWRPAGSPAQWQRPRPRIRGCVRCVRTRDRTAKPRWRWVHVGHAKRTPEFATWEMRRNKVIPRKANRRRGVWHGVGGWFTSN